MKSWTAGCKTSDDTYLTGRVSWHRVQASTWGSSCTDTEMSVLPSPHWESEKLSHSTIVNKQREPDANPGLPNSVRNSRSSRFPLHNKIIPCINRAREQETGTELWNYNLPRELAIRKAREHPPVCLPHPSPASILYREPEERQRIIAKVVSLVRGIGASLLVALCAFPLLLSLCSQSSHIPVMRSKDPLLKS